MSKKLFCDVCGKEMPNEGFQKDFYYARYCGSGYPSHHPDYDICTPCFQDMLQHVVQMRIVERLRTPVETEQGDTNEKF